ncbi:CPA_1a_G0023490.mRNA.1.CDS.1 [Saccharomyces cerevisiae]|nr:CPA_1a_G0023490.mRNA.1.CDS.1 [Saccharomyces cerevisiae]CAI7327692.1 CPA_1a_G0023490.mRNA.1.CDS.1 [Saccharomyces cerevisiae]
MQLSKFVAYEQIRNTLIPSKEFESHWRRLVSGSLAGLCSVFITYPLDLVRVRLAYETEHKRVKLGRIIKKIYTEPASTTLIKNDYIPNWFCHWCNFYRGYVPTVLGMIPYAELSEDDELERVQKKQRRPLRTWAELISGGLAGMASQTAAYPFEIIRRRLQVSALSPKNMYDHKFQSISEIAQIIFRERGVRGFFVGLSIGYIKVTPMVACSFFVYERMKWNFGI